MDRVIPNFYPNFLKCVTGVVTHNAFYGIPDANGRVVLREDDDGGNPHTLKEVSIMGLPANTCVFSAHCLPYGIIETDGNSTGIWKDVEKYRHVSDYIIITESSENVLILYVEMKTGFKSKKYVPQLRCAHGQIQHLLYLIKHLNCEVFPNGEVKHRFVKFTKIPVIKGETKNDSRIEFVLPNPPNCNDDPTTAFQCFVNDSDAVKFNDLILP